MYASIGVKDSAIMEDLEDAVWCEMIEKATPADRSRLNRIVKERATGTPSSFNNLNKLKEQELNHEWKQPTPRLAYHECINGITIVFQTPYIFLDSQYFGDEFQKILPQYLCRILHVVPGQFSKEDQFNVVLRTVE